MSVKVESAKRTAMSQLQPMAVEESKEQAPRNKVVKASAADAVPFIPRRTRKSFVSSIVRIGRNFQKPVATARLAHQNVIRNQCDAAFKGAVKISKLIFEGYVNEINACGMPRHLALCQISDRIGKGIFLRPDADEIPANTFVGIYSGEFQIVHKDDLERSSYAFTVLSDLELSGWELDAVEGGRNYETNQFYLEVEAARTGNFTRYLNHAKAGAANMEYRYILMPDGTIQVGLWTKKGVFPGDQLMYDYGDDFWFTHKIVPDEVGPRTFRLYPDGSVS